MGSCRPDTPDGGRVFAVSAHGSESVIADKLTTDSVTGNEETKTD
jgi:hypothetical protein